MNLLSTHISSFWEKVDDNIGYNMYHYWRIVIKIYVSPMVPHYLFIYNQLIVIVIIWYMYEVDNILF